MVSNVKCVKVSLLAEQGESSGIELQRRCDSHPLSERARVALIF